MMRALSQSPIKRRALTIRDFCHTYSIGSTTASKLVDCGALEARRIGRRVLIDVDSAEAWYQSLPRDRNPRRN